MAKHRRSAPPRRVALGLTIAKAASVGALLSVTTGAWMSASQTVEPRRPDLGRADAAVTEAERTMRLHRCSATGFGAAAQPAGAVVRTDAGRLRTVTFDEGWAVFTGERPGTLVAVCLDPPRASPTR
ncbi:hypothetical protein [Nocardioides ferulae]|uniref:hypothetical protein n=1 Tax=Nocardioides ferulae TaxID=2340821 RepID=UPI000F85C6DB|nr:hypothetical protein [Nocardioides ferulae]